MQHMTDLIREKYGETARSGLSSDDVNVRAVAEAFGYSAHELAAIPAEANMGLSCGNPIATASLREGETVVDLGSGGGLDVFLAASKVGEAGKAIGIDMTQDMIDLANRNKAKGNGDGQPYDNVEFKLGHIDDMPIDDASVDVVISNCVINLADDKSKVFAEMFRVLKPGGRVAVSDIALKRDDMPEALRTSAAALVGCIAGAISTDDYESGLRDAGFDKVVIMDTGADLTAYGKVDGQSACCTPEPSGDANDTAGDAADESGCCGGSASSSVSLGVSAGSGCCSSGADGARPASAKPMHRDLGELLEQYDINAYAASVKVFAVKPG